MLAGLFAMHGLGDHSGRHAVVHSAMVSSVHGAMPPMTDLAASAPELALPTGDDTSGTFAPTCVAVLLGGLFAWLLVVSSRRSAPWRLPRQVRAAVPVPRSRAPDPPSPIVLSVHRC